MYLYSSFICVGTGIAREKIVRLLFEHGAILHELNMSKSIKLRKEQKYLIDTFLHSLESVTLEHANTAMSFRQGYNNFMGDLCYIEDPEQWIEAISHRLRSASAEFQHAAERMTLPSCTTDTVI